MHQQMPVQFPCQGKMLYGMVHLPVQPARRGVLVIVGGPQYRVGSHRQFLLLARALADAGIPVMRFDYRGMGDSEGEIGTPEPCEQVGPDIRAALGKFFTQSPGLEEVVLWGLCDGASAAMLYAPTDKRVNGLVLLNPWVDTRLERAQALVKDYYRERIISSEFWRKLLRGELSLPRSMGQFLSTLRSAAGNALTPHSGNDDTPRISPIHPRMAAAMRDFDGRVLLVLSGKDITASEFRALFSKAKDWQPIRRSGRVEIIEVAEADHTFSCRTWRNKVAEQTLQWVCSGENIPDKMPILTSRNRPEE